MMIFRPRKDEYNDPDLGFWDVLKCAIGALVMGVCLWIIFTAVIIACEPKC